MDKPCGFPYHCPLYDEGKNGRLFSEAVEQLVAAGYETSKMYAILPMVKRAWCSQHVPSGVEPDLSLCIETVIAAVAAYLKGPKPEAFCITTLRGRLRERKEKQEWQTPDLGLAPF